MRLLLALFTGMLVLSAAVASPRKAIQGEGYRMEIVLERNEANVWRTINSRSILDQKDRVRFRFKANFGGYLYVINLSTSARTNLLFPTREAGEDNRIEAGKEYLIPATDGAFQIAGPAGHELVYWMVSPTALGAVERRNPESKLAGPDKPDEAYRIVPRCDDAIFKARGDCVDVSAGPNDIKDMSKLPRDLAAVPKVTSRDLVFSESQTASVIVMRNSLDRPTVYEFRLSHR